MSTETPPAPAPADLPPPKKVDESAARLKVSGVIVRWKIINPSLFINAGGMEKVEDSIKDHTESALRAIAATVEMVPFIAQKATAAMVVKNVLHKPNTQSDKMEHKEWLSLISILTGVLVCGGLLLWSWWLTPTMAGLSRIQYLFQGKVFAKIAIASIAIIWARYGFMKVDTQHSGMLTLLGKRTGSVVNEGYYWFPRPIMGLISMDLTVQVAKLPDISLLAGIVNNAEQAVRQIHESIPENFAVSVGIEVIEIVLPTIVPENQDIVKALEEVAIAEARQKAMVAKSAALASAAKKFRDDVGVNASVAMNAALIADDRDPAVLTERDEIAVTGTTESDRMLGTLAAIFSRVLPGGGGGGGGKKRKNRDGGNQS